MKNLKFQSKMKKSKILNKKLTILLMNKMRMVIRAEKKMIHRKILMNKIQRMRKNLLMRRMKKI